MHSYNAEILIPDLPIHPPSHIWIPQNDGLSLDQTSGRPLKGCFTTNLAKKSKSNRSDPTVVGQSPQFDQFPTCQVGVSGFTRVTSSFLASFLPPSFLPPDLNRERQISVGTAGRQRNEASARSQDSVGTGHWGECQNALSDRMR